MLSLFDNNVADLSSAVPKVMPAPEVVIDEGSDLLSIVVSWNHINGSDAGMRRFKSSFKGFF